MSKLAKSILAVSVIAGIAVIAYGGYNFVKEQIKLAMNFCYKIANIKFVAISNNLVSFIVDLKFLQNSDFRIKIKGYFLNIAINGRVVASVKDAKEIDILPKAVSYVSTSVSFNPAKIFDLEYITELIYSATVDQSNFIIEISGSINAQINFISVPLPIKIKMTLAEIMKPTPIDSKQDKQMVCKIY